MTADRRMARKAALPVGVRSPVTRRPLATAGLWIARLSRRLRRDEGAMAMVEWALVLPVLLGLTLGTIEMSRLWFAYNNVSQAAMEGARYAVVSGATSDTPASSDDIRDFVKGRVAGLDPAAVAVTVSWDSTNYPGYPVTVRVDYDFNFVALGLGPVPLSRASTMVISR